MPAGSAGSAWSAGVAGARARMRVRAGVHCSASAILCKGIDLMHAHQGLQREDRSGRRTGGAGGRRAAGAWGRRCGRGKALAQTPAIGILQPAVCTQVAQHTARAQHVKPLVKEGHIEIAPPGHGGQTAAVQLPFCPVHVPGTHIGRIAHHHIAGRKRAYERILTVQPACHQLCCKCVRTLLPAQDVREG